MISTWRCRAMGAVVLSCALAAGARAVNAPPGFVVENTAPGAVFDTPVAIAFLPDGRMLVAEKAGRVYAVQNGVKRATPMWDGEAEVLNHGDRGLLDVAVDPHFPANHYVYLLYTVDPGLNDGEGAAFGRLTRYQVSATDPNVVDPSTRVVLIGATWPEGFCSGSPSHGVGSLRWGEDGSLLVSAGDGASFGETDAGGLHPTLFDPGRSDPYEDIGAFRAQSLSSLSGKVLRIDPSTGYGYPSNPYYDGNLGSKRSKIWAYGFRNPFRIAVKPGTGSANPALGNPGVVYVGDVGWTYREELDAVTTPGKNFGWPCYEGSGGQESYQAATPSHNGCGTFGTADNPAAPTFPLADWTHYDPDLSHPVGMTGNCVVGGTFVSGNNFPSLYQDRLFFADYVANYIDVLVTDASHQLVQVLPFATDANGPVDLEQNPITGDLYYVALESNEIRRFRYLGTGGNTPPVARAGGAPTGGLAPLTVAFSSAGSNDPDSEPISHLWEFGDGATSNQPDPTHVFSNPGTYQVILTVSDARGGSAQDGLLITVATTAPLFPTTGVLDAFNRANGVIGGAWVGNTSGLVISNNALTQASADSWAVWNPAVFGAAQEAYFTLAQTTAAAPEHGLMLKVQGSSWVNGHIEVRYDATAGRISVYTYLPGLGWELRGAPIARVLAAGDQLGARVMADGLVEVYVNGTRLGTASVATWPYAVLGGRIGMKLVGATQTRLDDFGGGDVVVPVETAPTVAILTPADGAFFATGDVIPLTSQLADAEEPADSLHARWDVDVHHNVHVHPSSFTLFTRDAIFPAENHDDGTGYFLGIRLRATDRAGLVDTAEVRIYPDVDLDPSPVTVGPETLGAGRPAQFRFAIRNHGRMAAPYSRWALEVGTTTIGSGDTLVAPRDSAVFILTVIPNLTPGVHPVRLVADSLGAVHETDEANNASMGVVRVASSGVLVSDDRVPKRIALSSPHPNPSVGSVGFTLDLPRACRVSFTVHDPQGREVWSDAERGFAAGRWTLHWDGASNQVRHVRPGLYLARIVVEGVVLTRRIAIVR